MWKTSFEFSISVHVEKWNIETVAFKDIKYIYLYLHPSMKVDLRDNTWKNGWVDED